MLFPTEKVDISSNSIYPYPQKNYRPALRLKSRKPRQNGIFSFKLNYKQHFKHKNIQWIKCLYFLLCRQNSNSFWMTSICLHVLRLRLPGFCHTYKKNSHPEFRLQQYMKPHKQPCFYMLWQPSIEHRRCCHRFILFRYQHFYANSISSLRILIALLRTMFL